MGADNNQSTVKVRLKVGDAEIDYEGTESFLRDFVFTKFERSLEKSGSKEPVQSESSSALNTDDVPSELDLDTNTVASFLDVKSGPDLAFAAAVNLRLIQNKPRFTRDEIRREMQSANAFYTKSHSSNLTNHLESLVKSHKLLRASGGEYSLSADAEKDARKILDNSR